MDYLQEKRLSTEKNYTTVQISDYTAYLCISFLPFSSEMRRPQGSIFLLFRW